MWSQFGAVVFWPFAMLLRLVRGAVALVRTRRRTPRHAPPRGHRQPVAAAPTPAAADDGAVQPSRANPFVRVADYIIFGVLCVLSALVILFGFGHLIARIVHAEQSPEVKAFLIVITALIAVAMVIVAVIVLRWFRAGIGVGYWRLFLRIVACAALLLTLLILIAAPVPFMSGLLGGTGDDVAATYIAEPTSALGDALAAKRSRAIRQAYRRIRARLGDVGMLEMIDRVRQQRPIVELFADQHDFDPVRIDAVIAQESEGVLDAVSVAGAQGLMQLMPDTATVYGAACGLVDPETDSVDPMKNICTGTTYLRYLSSDRFHDDLETAHAAYNGGETRINDQLAALPRNASQSFWSLQGTNLIPAETSTYVPSILAWDAIFRYIDDVGAPPPSFAALHGDAPTHSRTARGGASGAMATGGGGSTGGSAVQIVTAKEPDARPTAVWYTGRPGDRYIGVVHGTLHDSNPEAIDTLNRKSSTDTSHDGTRIYLPEDRYIFHRASGAESYAEIADRYHMSTSDVLRWSGRWSALDVAKAELDECAWRGCGAGRLRPRAGAQLLVRR
ncbi:MAG: transglycosylase SLT domain-containing protein [Candidatus Uhrbacteria bacterium]